jgi:hypothetical protein
MLSADLALKLANLAGPWLRKREPSAWLAMAIVVTSESGKHVVLPRAEASLLVDKARALARTKGRADLEAELSAALDLVKGSAPIEVPLIAMIETEGGELDTGVIFLRLPLGQRQSPKRKRPGG